MTSERTSRRREIGKRLHEAAQYYLEHRHEPDVDKQGVAYMFDVNVNSLSPAVYYIEHPEDRHKRRPRSKREEPHLEPMPPAPGVLPASEGVSIGILCPGVTISISAGHAIVNGVTLTKEVMELVISTWCIMNPGRTWP